MLCFPTFSLNREWFIFPRSHDFRPVFSKVIVIVLKLHMAVFHRKRLVIRRDIFVDTNLSVEMAYALKVQIKINRDFFFLA